MERAILLARQLKASLLVLHVLSADGQRDSGGEQKLRAEITDAFDFKGVDAEILLEHGSVPDAIADVARLRRCELVVTGVARFNSPRDFILGTAVDYLVRRSPASVLVVKLRARRPYGKLLAATDFSECSVTALRTAAMLFPKALLRIVHSFHAAWEAFLDRESTIDLVRDECDRSMKRLLDGLPKEIRSRAEGVNDEGSLDAVIAEEIANWGAELLVVGSHGRSGFAHATIGDTAAGLLDSAACDVLVVRE
jgi:nucleotide-binding universal stress UspA family protein